MKQSEERTNCLEPSGSVFSYFRCPAWDNPSFAVGSNGFFEAAKKLEEATGIIAVKTPNVGCKIIKQNIEVSHD